MCPSEGWPAASLLMHVQRFCVLNALFTGVGSSFLVLKRPLDIVFVSITHILADFFAAPVWHACVHCCCVVEAPVCGRRVSACVTCLCHLTMNLAPLLTSELPPFCCVCMLLFFGSFERFCVPVASAIFFALCCPESNGFVVCTPLGKIFGYYDTLDVYVPRVYVARPFGPLVCVVRMFASRTSRTLVSAHNVGSRGSARRKANTGIPTRAAVCFCR